MIDTEKIVKKALPKDNIIHKKILGVAERSNPEREYTFPTP